MDNSPFDTAGILSILTFDYVRPLLRKGVKAAIVEDDLPPMANRDDVTFIVGKVDRCWANECKRAQQSNRIPKFIRALFYAFRFDFILGSLLSFVEVMLVITQILLLRPFLLFIASNREDTEGYQLAAGMAFTALCLALVHHQNFLVNMRAGWNLRISVIGLLHKKLLKVSQQELGSQDSASVYNLIASDVQRFGDTIPLLHLGTWSFVGSMAAIYLLIQEVGFIPAMAGASTILLYMFVQLWFARKFASRRSITAHITDERVRLTSEMLGGIGSLKAYAWERAFLKKLSKLRQLEHKSIFVSQSMKACTGALYFAVPAIASAATFTTYTYATNNELDVDRVFVTIAILNMIRLFVGAYLGRLLEAGPECLIAIGRMKKFLMLSDVKPRQFTGHVIEQGRDNTSEVAHHDMNVVIDVREASYGREVVNIEKIDLSVAKGELVMIAGPIGCGKSTLLEGMLGEVHLMAGSCELRGTVAYSPQEAWIMAGTVLSNILFGEPYDAARLAKVIEVCALTTDVEQLADGLNTEIGEKGCNLSGGQRARISLARTCYAKADIVLLDDPLSAVDPSVAKHIFFKCILGWLVTEQRSAVVLVTHQRQFMPNVDRVVLMDGGEVVARKKREAALQANFKMIRKAIRAAIRANRKIGFSNVVLDKMKQEGIKVHDGTEETKNSGEKMEKLGLDDVESKRLKQLLEKNKPKRRTSDTSLQRSKKKASDSSLTSKNSKSSGDGGAKPGADVGDDDKSVATVKSSASVASSVGSSVAGDSIAGLSRYPNRPDLRIYNNTDHNSTCGRIVAQGKFSKLLSVGYVNQAIEQKHQEGAKRGKEHHLAGVKEALDEEERSSNNESKEEDDVSDLEDGDDAAEERSSEVSDEIAARIEEQAEDIVESMKVVEKEFLDKEDDEISVALDKKIDKETNKMMKTFGIDVEELSVSKQHDPTKSASFSKAISKENAKKRASQEGWENVGPLEATITTGATEVAVAVEPKSASAKLVGAEDRETGDVNMATWIAYARASGTWLVAIVFFLFIAGQALLLLGDWWLVVWATAKDQDKPYYVTVFLCLTLSTAAASFLRAILFFTATLKASSNLHKRASSRLFYSPLSFFAATPMGRILNRFSADLSIVDENLSVALFETIQLAFITASGFAIACVILPIVTVLIPPILGVMIYLRQYTTVSMRELKRLDGTTRSPCYTAFRAATVGLSCIRAYGKTELQQTAFIERLDRNAATYFWWLITSRWFGFWLDFMVFLVVASTTSAAVVMRKSVEPGLVGLALVYVLNLSGLFEFMMRQSATVETYMTSVERINHYASNLELEETVLKRAVDEAPPVPESPLLAPMKRPPGPPGLRPDRFKLNKKTSSSFLERVANSFSFRSMREEDEYSGWPRRGEVILNHLRLRYRHDLPEVVKGINARLQAGTKIGVVGRTGSGKSSLLLALSRLNEICGGQVLIDGVDTCDMPLSRLREGIFVIPQEPHMFSGSIRFNMDPFEKFSDEQIWAALTETNLKSIVQEHGGLSGEVTEAGGNWSIGQKQLLSIARAVLFRRQIVLLDEATASVDFENDQLIQHMLRTSPAFKQATLIVIAHRIDTIIDSDMIMVMDSGNLIEVGKPQELIAQDGVFASMVAASQGKTAQASQTELPASNTTSSSKKGKGSVTSFKKAAVKSRGLIDGDAPPPAMSKVEHPAIKTMANSQGRLGTSLDGV